MIIISLVSLIVGAVFGFVVTAVLSADRDFSSQQYWRGYEAGYEAGREGYEDDRMEADNDD